MALVELAVRVLHLVFAAGWVGTILFVAGILVPEIRQENLSKQVGDLMDRVKMTSRISALVLFLTGSHLAATNYTAETLFGTGAGHLVLTMVGLWVVFTGLVEVGSGRLGDDAYDRGGHRLMQIAGAVGVALLVVGGILA